MPKGSNNLSGRRSSHNTKPYDANNSFVKKVATKVTDLMPQKSWITKWFNSSQNEENALGDNEILEEEIESEKDSQNSPPLKRKCIRMDVAHPPGTFSIQPRTKQSKLINKSSPCNEEYTIHDETSDDFCKPAMAGPSGMGYLVSSTPATHSDITNTASQRSELNSLVSVTNNGTVNGADDNSESSESTSGCSSLIPQVNRQEAPSNVSYNSPFACNKRFKGDKLNFSNHMQSSKSLFLDTTRDSLSSRRPSFNASIMTNTLDRTSSLASPFYSGNTTFGGANAAGLYKRGRSLFNSSNEIQLKVPKRTCVEVKPSNSAKVDSSGMSQTAKKILEALEHFSSPITDAKKIPLKMMNNTSSMSQKRPREETTSRRVGLRHLTRELTVPTVPDILKLRRRQKLQDTTAAARKIVSALKEPPPPQEYHLRTQISDKNTKHQGKVKSKAANLEEEETIQPVNLPNIALPISSLPKFNFIPSTNSVTVGNASTDEGSTFTFASPIKVSNATKNLKSINNFTFSSPINAEKQSEPSNDTRSPLKGTDAKSSAASNVPPVAQNFMWSGPSTAPRPREKPWSSERTLPSTANEVKSGSVINVLCSKKPEKSSESNSIKESSNNKTSLVSSSTTKGNSNSKLADSKSNVQGPESVWECSECLLKNNDSETQCFACKIAKPDLNDKKVSALPSSESKTGATEFGSQFKLSSSQWECTSCFVRNKQTDTKCAACSALKSDTKQETKSNPIQSSNVESAEKSWECSNCHLKNYENLDKCSSCDTSKLTLLKTSSQKSVGDNVDQSTSVTSSPLSSKDETVNKFKSNKDTWECPCCMVRNATSVNSCPCCNTAKPGVATKNVSLASSLANGFGDKFKKPEGSWSCDACMVQNDVKVTECVACGGLKPGTKKSDSSSSTSSSSNLQFNFGIPANVQSCTPVSGFKFGIDKTDQQKAETTLPTNGFKFGESQQSSQVNQFTFGIQKEKEENKTSEVQKTESNAPSTTGLSLVFSVSESGKSDAKQDSEKKPTPVFGIPVFGIPKTENKTVKNDKQANASTSTTASPVFTFGAPKITVSQSNTKEEKQSTLLESSTKETTKAQTTESVTISTSTLTSVIQSTTQESKPTVAFSFGTSSNTMTFTSSSFTSVASSLPSSIQSSFTFFDPKYTTQASMTSFGQITTSTPSSNLSSTFTFGDSKAKEGSTNLNKTTFGALPNTASGNLLFMSATPSLFSNNDTKTAPTFGQASEDKKQPTFGATTSTTKPSTFAMPENKVPTFGGTEAKPSIFGSSDNKIPVFGNTENKTTLFNPPTTTQTPAAIFGAPIQPLQPTVTPVFGSNTAESTPSIFGSTLKTNETSTPNSSLFTFGNTPAQPVAKPGTGFNFSASTNPADTAQKPLFTFGNNSATPQGSTLFGNAFSNPTSSNTSGFTFNAPPKPEATAFAQPAATPMFGAQQPVTQNQPSSSFSTAPSSTGFNFGSAPPVTSSGGFNFGAAPASAPSTGFNFNPPNATPTFDPNTPPSYNFTSGNAPATFNAPPQRKIRKALRRMR